MEFTSFLKASQTYGSIEDFHKTGHKKTALETFCEQQGDMVEEDKENEAEEPKDDEDDDDEDKNDGNDDDEDDDEDKNEDDEMLKNRNVAYVTP